MSEKRNNVAHKAATAVLLVVILLVTISLTVWTELDFVARLPIAVGAGVLGALITFIAVGRTQRS